MIRILSMRQMIKLDTIKASVLIDQSQLDVQGIEKSSLPCNYYYQNDGYIYSYSVQNRYLPIGVNNLNLKLRADGKHEAIFNISSKVLQSDYLQLINKNNIGNVCRKLNSNSVLQIDQNQLLDAKVFRCDVTTDIRVGENPKEYIEAVSILVGSKKYSVDDYGDYESVVFRRKAKSIKERVIFYRKYPEMLKNDEKFTKRFLSSFDIVKMKQIVRVENNLVTKKDIKQKLQIHDNTLKDILLSQAKPNYQFFAKIKENVLDIFQDSIEYKTFNQFITVNGWNSLFEKCGYQEDVIDKFIKSLVKGNISPYRSKYRPLLQVAKSKHLQENNLTPRLQEIEHLLKVG